MKMKNFHNDRFRGQVIGCLLTITFILAGMITVYAQPSGGTNSPQGSDTGHKADQNLKSVAKVNPSTLAMEFSIPFMNYPGRNGSSVPVAINYSSKVWRLDTSLVWWYSNDGIQKKYVTDINGVFGEYTAAGWTSNLMAPRLDEKLEIYNQNGKSFNSTLDDLFGSGSLQNSQLCQKCTHQWQTCVEPSIFGCLLWREGECSRYEIYACSPTTTINGQPHQLLDKTHYVKRVYVMMPDGSSHEFRKSDAVFGFCSENGQNNPTNCEGNGEDRVGTYLSVDGSAMKLVRPTAEASDQRAILYLPNGTRYFFPVSTEPLQGTYASESIDADGNKISYSKETVDNLTIRKIKDTLGREIVDPLPHNWDRQEMLLGDVGARFPGLNEQTQDYVLKWRRLKPEGCETSTSPTCGIDENGEVPGALENQSEKLYYTFKTLCQGNLTTELSTTEVLFPQWQLGHRLCNPFVYQDVNGTQTEVGVRFNPVVLSEIKLPNNKSYKFRYNRYGEITKIIYPTESYETFTYDEIPTMGGQFTPIYSQSNRGVTEHRVYNAQGTLQQLWKYSAIINGTTATAPYKVTTIASRKNDPNVEGMKTERYLWRSPDPNPNDIYGNFGFEDPRAGMPIEEKTFDENGALRSRTLTDWTVAPPRSGGEPRATRDPRVKRKISVMIEGGQALASLSETEYNETGVTGNNAQTDPEYFSHLNVKRVKAYHYAVVSVSNAENGSIDDLADYFNDNLLANTAETDYQYDANYKARGISSLPTESRVYDKHGNVITKSQTIYDEQNYIELNGSGTLSSSLTNTWTNPGTYLRGKPTTSKVWDDDNDRWISTHTTYDQYGNPRKVWEAVADPDTPSRFVETEYSLDYGFAYPTKVITPAPSDGVHGTNLGSQASTTYDYTTGLPLTATNEFNQTTATEYADPLLRPTRSYAVNFSAPESQTIYDDNALTVKVRKQIDEQNWDEAITFADSLGRTVKTQAKDSQGDVIVETKYDLLGRPMAVTNPYREGDTVYWSKTRYDEMGRAVEAFAPATWHPTNTGDSLGSTEYGISSQTGFVGTVVTKTDASGRKSRSFTNALGQIIRVDEPGSNNQLEAVPQTTPSPNPSPTPPPTYPTDPPSCVINCPNNLTGSEYPMHSTYYEYNVQGKMVKVTQGVQKRYFLYDSLGRLIRVKQPEQEVNDALDKSDPSTQNDKWTARFTYDLFGNVLTTTDAKGVTITSTYDKADRVLTKVFSGEPQGQTTPPVEYFYDGYGLGVTPPATNNYAKGKLTKVTSSISETRYTKFDSFGRLEEMEQRTPFGSESVANATPQVSKYKYDFGGRLIEETYPSGRVVKNTFEADGDLSAISSKAGTQVGFKTFASNFTTTASGLIDKLQIGSGRWETAKFNTRQQVTELGLGNAANDTSLWKVNYAYGEANPDGTINAAKNTGNIAQQTITIAGLAQPFVQTYQYDSLYRITEAKEVNGTGTTPNWQQNWSYDRYGNRQAFAQNINGVTSNLTPTVNENTNRFTAGQGFIYDKNGNITADVDYNQTRSFVFNGDNKQVEINKNGILVGKYFYDGEGKRVKKVTDLETTIFVYSSGKLVAEYSTKLAESPSTNYTTTDHLGSPRVITDKLGQIKSRRDFMPFGEDLGENVGSRSAPLKYGAADEVRQKFTGYQKDTETGLDFAEARMYNNAHGRFTAVDPLLASGMNSNPQTFNRYVYSLNSPLMYTDPDGRFCCRIPATVLIPTGPLQDGVTIDANGRVIFDQDQRDPIMDSSGFMETVRMFNYALHGRYMTSYEILIEATNVRTQLELGDYGQVNADGSFSPFDLASLSDLQVLNLSDTINQRIRDGSMLDASDLPRVAEIIPDVAGAAGSLKPVNLPSANKVSIDMNHIKDRHTVTGKTYQDRMKYGSKGSDAFPDYMTDAQIERTVRNAYSKASVVKTQGDSVLLRGVTKDGTTIEMWYNRSTKIVETAYPVR